MTTKLMTTSSTLVLHITESFGGGVRGAINDYARNAPQYDHALLYATRADSPLLGNDLNHFVWANELPEGHVARVRAVREIIALHRPHVVHAHSSFGGAYARLAASHRNHRLVYTPHCYAFEREDLSGFQRYAFQLAERALSWNTSVVAACSPREAELASKLHTPDVQYIPNVMPEPSREPSPRDPATLVGAGRASAQKDPEYFASAVRAIRAAGRDVRAIWVGGDDDLRRRFASDNIEVTGWVPREAATKIMAAATAYLHTARWEGFPLALLEAAAVGTPIIARRINALDGFHLSGVIDSPEDVVAVWHEVSTGDAASRFVREAHEAFRENTDAYQGEALSRLYAGKSDLVTIRSARVHET